MAFFEKTKNYTNLYQPTTIKEPETIKGTLETINTNSGIFNLNWEKWTILVAEDEDNNFDYLKSILDKTKINVIRARNGKECVEKVRSNNNIDIVLMDLRMPVMNGIEATRAIKTIKPDMVVVAQTAFAMEENRRNCKVVGCNEFLAKPIRYKILVEILGKYIEH